MPEFEEGKTYKVVYRLFSCINDDEWEKDYKCAKCGNTKWLVSFRTGTKTLKGEDIKLKCTECGSWFITKTRLLTKVLGK
jgi:DNA-directed RNA polymerase subunit RPC12/RpoP